MTGAVIGDAAPTVHINDRRAIARPLVGLRPASCCVNRSVFDENYMSGPDAAGHARMDCSLVIPCLAVVAQARILAETEIFKGQGHRCCSKRVRAEWRT